MDYLIHLAILISIYGILALSLNLVVGYTGLLSIAHAAFFGIGAYATAILTKEAGWNFFLALPIAMIISALAALAIGLVLSKFKGDYYALGSVGFNVIVYSIMLNWQELTRGPLGIAGISRPSVGDFSFSENSGFLILSLAFLALVFLASRFIVNSSFGRALKAIREDETATKIFGYNTPHYKLLIFIIGAAMAAVGGALFATYITFIDPSSFTINESIFILAVIIFGGLANLRGAILGAVILFLLPEFLRFVGFPSEIAAQMRLLSYGVILILLMLYRPQGLVGEYKL